MINWQVFMRFGIYMATSITYCSCPASYYFLQPYMGQFLYSTRHKFLWGTQQECNCWVYDGSCIYANKQLIFAGIFAAHTSRFVPFCSVIQPRSTLCNSWQKLKKGSISLYKSIKKAKFNFTKSLCGALEPGVARLQRLMARVNELDDMVNVS